MCIFDASCGEKERIDSDRTRPRDYYIKVGSMIGLLLLFEGIDALERFRAEIGRDIKHTEFAPKRVIGFILVDSGFLDRLLFGRLLFLIFFLLRFFLRFFLLNLNWLFFDFLLW